MGFAEKILKAMRQMPKAIRDYWCCDHDFKFVGETKRGGWSYSHHKCTKCNCTRVATDKPPMR